MHVPAVKLLSLISDAKKHSEILEQPQNLENLRLF